MSEIENSEKETITEEKVLDILAHTIVDLNDSVREVLNDNLPNVGTSSDMLEDENLRKSFEEDLNHLLDKYAVDTARQKLEEGIMYSVGLPGHHSSILKSFSFNRISAPLKFVEDTENQLTVQYYAYGNAGEFEEDLTRKVTLELSKTNDNNDHSWKISDLDQDIVSNLDHELTFDHIQKTTNIQNHFNDHLGYSNITVKDHSRIEYEGRDFIVYENSQVPDGYFSAIDIENGVITEVQPSFAMPHLDEDPEKVYNRQLDYIQSLQGDSLDWFY